MVSNTEMIKRKEKVMSELICPVDGVHYFSEGILGKVCPCCYGRELITNNIVFEPQIIEWKELTPLRRIAKVKRQPVWNSEKRGFDY